VESCVVVERNFLGTLHRAVGEVNAIEERDNLVRHGFRVGGLMPDWVRLRLAAYESGERLAHAVTGDPEALSDPGL
jgi:hypothetical protein